MLRLLKISGLSLVGALGCAVLFFVAFQRTVPPSDATYGQSPFKVLWDPFVLSTIALVGAVSGLLTTPVAYLLLRGKKVGPCAAFVFATVCLEIVLVTPWLGLGGFLGAYVVLFAALLYCRSSRHRWFSDDNRSA